ncbi:MAG: hypothetical protein ACRDYD_11685, partial [Acidimicrobiales bacterium]
MEPALAVRALDLAGAGQDREAAVGELVKLADGDRGPLEEARDHLVLRLQQRSDDYAASFALRVVISALDRTGFHVQPFT